MTRAQEVVIITMPSQSSSPTVSSHFAGKKPTVRATYDAIVSAAKTLGPVEEDPKKTSIHLNRKSAFAGIVTRKTALILTLKSAMDIASPRVAKREQASANRWHIEIRLERPSDVNRELIGWLKGAYALAS
jgi:hypothetical protein